MPLVFIFYLMQWHSYFFMCVYSVGVIAYLLYSTLHCVSLRHMLSDAGAVNVILSLSVIPYCNKSFWVCTRMQFVTVSVCKNIYELMWTLFTQHVLWLHFWKCLHKYNKISWYILRYLNGPQDILQSKKKATRVPWHKQVSESKTIVLNDYSTTLIFTGSYGYWPILDIF